MPLPLPFLSAAAASGSEAVRGTSAGEEGPATGAREDDEGEEGRGWWDLWATLRGTKGNMLGSGRVSRGEASRHRRLWQETVWKEKPREQNVGFVASGHG